MSETRKCPPGLAAISSALMLGAALLVPHAAAAQKIVTVVLSEEPDTLDMCNANRSAVGRVVKQNIGETLTEIDTRDGSIQPRLATSWQKLDDTTWRFNLREDVTYTDGAALNAETAAKSISRTMDSELACLVRTSAFGDLKLTGKPVSTYVLDIVTSKPDPILPTRMGVLSLSSPNTRLDKLVIDPVGTGPYMLDRYVPGQEVVLKRNPNYWGKKPEADGARYIWRGEPAVRAAMVALGEADIAPDIAKQDATNPATDSSYPNSETNYLRIDAQLPPLDDRRVRLALNYAIDRDGLRGTVIPKEVLHATQMVAPSIIGHNHDLDKQVRAYDPARARQLLAEAKAAGVPVDRKIQMIGRTGFYPNSTELIEAIHTMYKAVGLNVELRVVEVGEWVQFNAKPFKEGRDPIIFQHMHDNNKGDPVFSVFNKYACGGTGSTHCNPELDKLIAKASVATGQERVDSWKEIFRIVYEDMVADVWLYHMVGYARVNPRIDFKPTMATNSEIHIEDIAFK